MVTLGHVYLVEDRATTEPLVEGLYVGKGVQVRLGGRVEATVIPSGSKLAIWLGDNM